LEETHGNTGVNGYYQIGKKADFRLRMNFDRGCAILEEVDWLRP
jgi:hypothetical protein